MITRKYHRRIFEWPEFNMNYWSVNKNASTSLREHFLDTVCERNGGVPELKRRQITHDVAFNNGLQNFGVSRDPLSRFISSYAMWHEANEEQNENIQISIAKARFSPDWSLEEYLDNVVWRFDNNWKINKHWRQQIWFIPEPQRLDCLVKMENLEKDWPLDALPPPPKKLNQTNLKYEIDNNLIQKIQELYIDDYEAFDYERI